MSWANLALSPCSFASADLQRLTPRDFGYEDVRYQLGGCGSPLPFVTASLIGCSSLTTFVVIPIREDSAMMALPTSIANRAASCEWFDTASHPYTTMAVTMTRVPQIRITGSRSTDLSGPGVVIAVPSGTTSDGLRCHLPEVRACADTSVPRLGFSARNTRQGLRRQCCRSSSERTVRHLRHSTVGEFAYRTWLDSCVGTPRNAGRMGAVDWPRSDRELAW